MHHLLRAYSPHMASPLGRRVTHLRPPWGWPHFSHSMALFGRATAAHLDPTMRAVIRCAACAFGHECVYAACIYVLDSVLHDVWMEITT